MESLDKEETRISVSQERIDAFLKEQDERHPVREETTVDHDTALLFHPYGSEVRLSFQAEEGAVIKGRKAGVWEELSSVDPGVYSMRFPRGDFDLFAVELKGSVQWR